MIEIKNLTKSFKDKIVLNDFSYEFSDKGLYAIVGNSGSGKTTLLRIIARLESFERGSLKGERKVSFSFQEYRLFDNLTVFENIQRIVFTKRTEESDTRIQEILNRLSLSDSKDKYPRELSGGMKQRVSLIRAFLSDASVILLDEPFKELDTSLVKIVVEIIQELSQDKLVIVSIHDELLADQIGAKAVLLT